MQITTTSILKVFGTQAKVAKFFNTPESPCTQQAVQQWRRFIPKVRAYELRDRRPDIYDQIKQGKFDQ